MPMRFWLMSVFVLMLLPFPLQAKNVYLALVSADLTKDIPNLDSLDAVIKTAWNDIDYYFQNGDFTLQENQELIIRGGRGSIKRELDQYQGRNVILNTGGDKTLRLQAFGCYFRRSIGRENTTYVMLRSNFWKGGRYCNNMLPARLGHTDTINLKSLGIAVAAIPDH
jgi:hypothetical protein